MKLSFVSVDFSKKAESEWKELPRTDSTNIPVNLIYPPNYPEEPAIKLEAVVSPADVNLVLDRMQEIVDGLKE
ncbi:hypothetical protein N9Y42_07730 [Mariniblastus sp.]|nr:hypothetical protein [Mariniblastus sp.]